MIALRQGIRGGLCSQSYPHTGGYLIKLMSMRAGSRLSPLRPPKRSLEANRYDPLLDPGSLRC